MAQPEVIKDIDARVKIPGDTMTGNLTAPTFIGSLQGNASSADKLNTNAGSPRQPVYFDSSGKPILAANDYVFYDEVSGTISSDNSSLFVLKTGDTMTGNLKVPNLDIANDICRGFIYGETNSLNLRGGNPTTEKYTYLKIAEDGVYIDNQKIYYPGNKPTPADIGTYTKTEINTLLTNKENAIKKTTVTLPTNWSGSSSPYTQTVTISGTTLNSKIDLQPDATVIQQMIDDEVVALYIINDNGILTAYAMGEKPTTSLTIQATITEVI